MPVEVAEQEACRKIIMHRLSLKKWNYEFQLDHNRDRLSICGSLMIIPTKIFNDLWHLLSFKIAFCVKEMVASQ